MERFYQSAWTDRRAKSEAIRQAMIYMLREYPWSSRVSSDAKGHRCPPWLWSSWVLYGDWR
jgi:CHAT domain-containing protein